MKIVSKPDWDAWRAACRCRKCMADLEIERNDLHHQCGEGDQREWAAAYFYVICPVCSERIVISDPIPEFIKDQTKLRVMR